MPTEHVVKRTAATMHFLNFHLAIRTFYILQGKLLTRVRLTTHTIMTKYNDLLKQYPISTAKSPQPYFKSISHFSLSLRLFAGCSSGNISGFV